MSDKTLRLVPDDALDPDYLVVAMGLQTSRKHLTGSATGTSASMFNISQDKIRATPIPLPLLDRQTEIVEKIRALRTHAKCLRDEIESLRLVRSATISALLNRELEIPESFDELLTEEVTA